MNLVNYICIVLSAGYLRVKCWNISFFWEHRSCKDFLKKAGNDERELLKSESWWYWYIYDLAFLRSTSTYLTGFKFWKLVPKEDFRATCDLALKILNRVGSTCFCEKAFFLLTASHISDLMLLSLSDLFQNIEKLLANTSISLTDALFYFFYSIKNVQFEMLFNLNTHLFEIV